MAFSKDTLNTAAGKAAELGKKGFSLYAEMVDKVMDSVVDLANSKKIIRISESPKKQRKPNKPISNFRR